MARAWSENGFGNGLGVSRNGRAIFAVTERIASPQPSPLARGRLQTRVRQIMAVEPEASILEIFASRQGEGICVGDPQVFVRFGGCNLACDYCDTPESIPLKTGPSWSLEQVLARMDCLRRGGHRDVVSLTGGEPLIQINFLEQLVPEL